MPQLTLSAAVQLVLLLSAFPAQYLIHKWSGNTAEQRLLASAKSALGVDMEGEADSATVETMMFDNDQGYFGASKEVRSPRPPYVFLRVGEVVVDRKTHRLGVVVSWDSEMRAPAEWVFRMYKGTRSVAAKKTPHYKVLFNGPGPNHVIVAYLPQTHLKRVTGKKPNIASLDHYFIGFDGDRFVPQTWLKEIFPEDDIDDV